MPRHLSDEMRECIVSWRNNNGISARIIANLVRCSVRAVHNIVAVHRGYGQVRQTYMMPHGRPRKIETADLDYMVSLLQAEPAMYLDELQTHLSAYRQLDVSIASISRTLRRIALSHKAIARSALERNKLLQATWQGRCGDIPKEYFIWLDESSVDNLTHQR